MRAHRVAQVPGWAAFLSPLAVKAVVLGEPTLLDGDLAVLRGRVLRPLRHRALGLRRPTPSAVLVGTDGLLAGGPALGEEVVGFVSEIRDHLRGVAVEAGVDAGAEVSDAP